MRLRLGRPAALAAAVTAAVAVAVFFSPSAGTATDIHSGTPEYGEVSTIGALFTLTAPGELGTHFCTASVVDSPAGDLVLTAAHCMSGRDVEDVAFVPDYAGGRAPFGIWTVTGMIMDENWNSSQDPDDDFAFLIVHRAGTSGDVEALTGGEALGVGETAGRPVEVSGYPDGQNEPIICANTALAFSPTQFEFYCDGFTDGTSGSPLLAGAGASTVIGVIGGYEQGGWTPAVSYAARFGTSFASLYRQALAAAGR